MRQTIRKAIQNPLISGSAVIFLGSNLSNLLNFLFNLLMSRNLTPSDYGTLISLVSLIGLSSYPVGALMPTIVRFAAEYFAKHDYQSIRGLFWKITRLSSSIGIVVLILFFLFTDQISTFFHITDHLLIQLSAVMILLGYISIANNALLQSNLAFLFISTSNLLGAFLKLTVGIILVLLGYRVGGAMVAFLISFIFPYILSFYPLRFIFKNEVVEPKITNTDLLTYGLPSAAALFGLTSFITTDILLVKHFFSTESAGAYSVLSLLGRIIYFFTAPISTVMFPLIAQKHTRNETFQNDFKLSLGLVLLPSILITIIFFNVPELIIRFATREEYVSVAPMLGLFGIYTSVYAILSILVNFFLSIKKTSIYIPIVLAALLQVILIWFYHDTFYHIIFISLTITTLLLIILLLYYWQLYGKEAKK